MKGLILADGRGQRMGDETRECPKCLVTLQGKPLLEWQLAALATADIEPCAIVTGYRNQLLADFCPNQFHNERWEQTNMVASLMCAADWFKDQPCIVSYSDIVYRSAHLERLSGCPGEIVITYDRRWLELWSLRMEDPLADAETFCLETPETLKSIGQKADSLDQIEGQFMGLIKITPQGFLWMRELLDQAPAGSWDKLDFTTFLRRLLEAGRPIGVLPVDAGWCEVDTLSDRDTYEKALASSQGFTHDWRN